MFECTLHGMATDYVAEIQKLQPTGPYHLVGYSLGGVIAHAVATELERHGERVALLVLIDSYLPSLADSTKSHVPTDAEIIATLPAVFGYLNEDQSTLLDIPDVIRFLAHRGYSISAPEERYLYRLLDLTKAIPALIQTFSPKAFFGNAFFFRSTKGPKPALPAAGWKRYNLGNFEIYDLPSDHLEIMQPEALEEICKIIRNRW
jgi:nonribosomal peptide synthetase DhbF